MPTLTIQDINEFDLAFKVYYDLMAKRVSEILLISSPYDAFIMEEDEPLSERIIHEYQGLNLSRPPRITWVLNTNEAFDILSRRKFDLIIFMPRFDDIDPYSFGKKVKQKYDNPPVFILTHSTAALFMNLKNADKSAIDKIFVWSGNTYLLLALVKNIEDRMNVEYDTNRAYVRVIILVEDNPMYCSSLLPFLYKEIVTQTRSVMEESLNEEDRILRMRARPKIIVAEDFEEAESLYRRFKPFVLSVFSDVRFPRNKEIDPEAGFELLSLIQKESPDIPLLVLSSDEINRQRTIDMRAVFMNKDSPSLHASIHNFLVQNLGFGDFIFCLPNGKEIARASNLRQMEKILPLVPDDSIYHHATRNHFSTWLMARSEIQLASKLRPLTMNDFSNIQEVRDLLITCIHERRKIRQKGVVTDFDPQRFDGENDFVRLGKGSLGGKARGLAFISTLLKENPVVHKKFPEVLISVPKSFVISTNGFDSFMSENKQNSPPSLFQELSPLAPLSFPKRGGLGGEFERGDAEIKKQFMGFSFPQWLRRDLEVFLSHTKYPLAVRSSSMLEDAQYQARAGIYNTYMIPNNDPSLEVRLEQLITAIKLVYASTFLEASITFAKNTVITTEEEKMAVIIQQLIGKQYGMFFYPALSGVAQSYNFYPVSCMKPEQGIVHLALGLGKTVVEGGTSLRFSPAYPQFIPHFSKVEDILKNSQKFFYALRMTDFPENFGNGNGTLIRLSIDDDRVKDHYPINALSSMYIAEEHRIRDARCIKGIPVLTFASLLKYKSFMLPELISELLDMGRKGMGCPVEIEFAVNLSSIKYEKPEFTLLQIRPMAITHQNMEVEITQADILTAVCYSESALGNGVIQDIADIVFVRPEKFNPANTVEIASEIKMINQKLKNQCRRFLLIGPGRWGSADPWLGIPITWNDISGVGCMIEASFENMQADPSQGSHFFNNITSLGIGYITVHKVSNAFINWEWLKSLAFETETMYLRNIRLEKPLTIKLNGKKSCAVITRN